ncbi:MAG: PAS domain S-box protein [Verrucomicrobia bacterium]|nr:PAS domain S-box protein [Verrucomicrobiota bacterium]
MPPDDSLPAAQSRLQAHLAGILEVALDCIVTVDHAGRFIDFNPAAERTFGYTRAEVLGREMSDLIVPPAMREGHRAGMARVLGGGAPRMLGHRIEITAMRADGTEFPVELAITRIATDGPPIFTAHLRDISARKQTEGELLALQRDLARLVDERTAELARANAALAAGAASQRESQSYFAKSFHSSPALMSIARASDGTIIEANPAFLSGSGYTREEVIGSTTLKLGLWLHAEQRDEFIRRLRTAGAIRDLEAQFRSRTGFVRTLLLNADVIELGGEPCMLTVGIEVTERRRREQVQAGIYNISQAVLSGDDLPTLLGKVHRIISGLMPAKNFYVAVLSADRSLLSFPYFVDETIAHPAPRQPRNGVTEFVIDTGEALLATDDEVVARLRARGDYTPGGSPCAQWMGAPLMFEGRGIGAIVVQDYHNPAAYTEEDKRLLLFVADQTAAAVHRQQVETAQREARTYFEKSFHSSPALMVINRVADRVITEANPAFLRACEYTREEVIGRTPEQIKLWVNEVQRDSFLRDIRERGAVRDLEADFRAKDGVTATFLINADVLELGGTPSVLSVGIDISDRRRRERVQTATYAISQAVLAGGDLTTLFAELHRIIGGLMPAKNFYVALLTPDRSLLTFPYYADEFSTPAATRKPGAGLTEYVINTAKPLRTTADELTVILGTDRSYKPTGRPAALWLGAPLMTEGRAIGVIAVQDYHNANAYSDADLQLLMFVADQTAAAVHRQQVEAAQRESRSYFEKSFHSSPALMSLNRVADRKFLEVNPAFTRSCGYTRDEVLGRTTAEIDLWMHEHQRAEFNVQIDARGYVRDLQADFRAKDGRITTLLVNADIVELGGEPCLLTVAIDITERRRRDQVQSATFQISRTVLAGGDLGVLFAEVHRIVDGLMSAKNFYVALLSPDGRELSFPYFVDEHVPPPPARQPGNGFTEYILQTGRPLLATAAELPALLRARGHYQPLEQPAAQRLGAPLIVGGRTLGVIALQDYTRADAYGEEDLRLLNFVAEQTAVAVQRRQAEDALARAEQRYRSIFENAVEGLYVTSPEGRFLSANPALARILGYASVPDLLYAVNDITHQIYVQPTRRNDFFALIQDSDEVADFVSEIYRRDRSTIWISESVRVVRDARGDIDHFEGVATDVTQQREAARALREAKEAADAASRAKSYFLASVSHELRTPLNGILGYTQILRRDSALSEKQREGVRVIHESADHLLALINDVLDLSKIEAGRIELHPADFDLPGFAAGVERVFTPRAREKNILFETAVASDLPRWVRGDEQRLRQIVFNLVSNAVKFTAAGGVVFSVQRAEGEAIRFSVSDTGPGISEEDIGRLFEPFTQVGKNQAASATGTGLGLAISRSLVERMGGRLRVESKPGWGSRFWCDVVLPVASVAGAPAPSDSPRRILGYEGPRRRILIVDDNATNRSVMVNMLAPLGFQLAETDTGEGSLTETAKFHPDLVLMDLRLPGGIDGLEATRRLRASPDGARVKIIAVSASAYDLDRNECFAAGCDAFLAKPFREEELWTAVERALGLAWHIADTEETRTPFPLALHAPPPAEAVALYDLAAKGDVVGIRARAAALVALDPKYGPFAQSVLDLAARFKMKAIRQFVARYLPDSPKP